MMKQCSSTYCDWMLEFILRSAYSYPLASPSPVVILLEWRLKPEEVQVVVVFVVI